MLAVAVGVAHGAGWSSGAPLPLPRSEVAAATLRSEIAIVGGFEADGGSSARIDVYSPARDSWRRLPDLPAGVNHAAAAAAAGRLYVVGGYSGGLVGTLRRAFVFAQGVWRELPRLPAARAAAGAAIVGGKLYVAGGRGPSGLARRMLVFDIARGRWSTVPGPTPREHLAVTAAGGRVYVAGGRRAGYDTNLGAVRELLAGIGRWGGSAAALRWRHGGRSRGRADRLGRWGGAGGHDRFGLRLRPRTRPLARAAHAPDAASRPRRRGGRQARLRDRRRHRAGPQRQQRERVTGLG